MQIFRNHLEKVLLLLVALGLFTTAALIFLKTADFRSTFTAVRSGIPDDDAVESIEMDFIETARAGLVGPGTWDKRGAIFSSTPYIELGGRLVDPVDDDAIALHPPVPNRWFLENELDILDQGILVADPDGDGFSNFDEWRGGTDPNDPADHPPYHTKLRLELFETIPFRLRFTSYTGDTYQINTIDVRQPSQFLRAGEEIAGTRFKISGFESKFRENPNIPGATVDVSELSVENIDTGETLVMVLNEEADSPDSFAVLRYLWDDTTRKVKRDATFTLDPETDVIYRLLSVDASGAVVKIEGSQETISIPTIQATRDIMPVQN